MSGSQLQLNNSCSSAGERGPQRAHGSSTQYYVFFHVYRHSCDSLPNLGTDTELLRLYNTKCTRSSLPDACQGSYASLTAVEITKNDCKLPRNVGPVRPRHSAAERVSSWHVNTVSPTCAFPGLYHVLQLAIKPSPARYSPKVLSCANEAS
jgi:hypothetical protein